MFMPPSDAASTSLPLGSARRGFRGYVEAIRTADDALGLSPEELEKRLIELGFVSGARVEVLHEGAFGRDPIAVRVNQSTIALRRKEAMAILVRPLEPLP
jgi:ferrous iron transport protein A